MTGSGGARLRVALCCGRGAFLEEATSPWGLSMRS